MASQGSFTPRVLESSHLFWDACNSPGGRQRHAHFTDGESRLKGGKSWKSPESEAEPDRNTEPHALLSVTARKLCTYTCACTHMCVCRGSCFHMCPRVALQLFLDAACADLLAGPACSRQFHPVGGGEEEKGGRGGSYTYIFVLPTGSSCCVLSSV